MARYIDAEKFAKRINASPAFKNMAFEGELLQRVVLDLLDNAPTEAAEEVKYGEWKDRYNNKYSNHLYECSVCGGKALYEFYKNDLLQWKERQALTPVCPHCGAKMDGERRDT